MSKIIISILCVLFCAIAVGPHPAIGNVGVDRPDSQKESAAVPKAVVAEATFVFEEVMEGATVTHAYILENQGTAPLQVRNVQTSCGCTTAERPQTIAPGSQDKIVVNGNTNGYGGTLFDKTITVFTNDPVTPQLRLVLKGRVTEFARISPRAISLKGGVQETLQAVANISPNPKFPFKIVETTLDDAIAEKIEVRLDQSKEIYQIVVCNRSTTPGVYHGRILLKTDSPIRPELSLYVNGRIVAVALAAPTAFPAKRPK